MAHGDHQSELDQKLNLRWEQAHNLKVVGSNPSPATTFTEPRLGATFRPSGPLESPTMLAISPTSSIVKADMTHSVLLQCTACTAATLAILGS